MIGNGIIRSVRSIGSIVTLILFSAHCVFAGTTGKISGRILDEESHQPLPSVNITLPGTSFGASSDVGGNFYILNIPPGSYSVRAQCIGYVSWEIKNIRVSADITTTIQIDLKASSVELSEVIVFENRVLIQPDLTASRSVVNAENIEISPLENYEDILKTQVGFSSDASGALHLRGGRSGEITYFLDGIPIESAQEGSIGGVFNNDAIKELQVLSGTFNAEYGNAQSGIVNIITKEGTGRLSGKAEYTTGQLNESPYHKQNAIVSDRNPEVETAPGKFTELVYRPTTVFDQVYVALPMIGTLNGYLSGSVPDLENFSFFLSGKYGNENSQLPHGFTLERTYFGKLTYTSALIKISAFADVGRLRMQSYDHRFKYRPELQNQLQQKSTRIKLGLTQTVSSEAYYTINLSRLEQGTDFFVPDIPIDSIAVRNLDSDRLFVISGADLQNQSELKTTYANADYSLQYNSFNLIKIGIEGKLHQISYNGVRPLSRANDLIVERAATNFSQHPIEIAAYIQDKIELDFLVANIGMRLDALDVQTQSLKDIQNLNSGLIDASRKIQISPRIGLAFPVTERTAVHFAYGHFSQYPTYSSMFTGLDLIRNPQRVANLNQPFIGNPDARPQRTVSFEVGLQSQVGEEYRFTVTSFYRDISNLLGGAGSQRSYDPTTGKIISYGYLDNVDFANSKGVEVAFGKERGNFFTGQINYMLSFAKGSNASPNIGIINVFTGVTQRRRDFYLDFDRRHVINLTLLFKTPRGFSQSIAGIFPFENLNLSIISQFASGFPYTPYTDDPTVEVEPNSARQPWTATTDIRIERGLLFGSMNWVLFVEATNVFDAINPLRVNTRTGKVWEDGRNLPLFDDFGADPSDAGLRRCIKAGFKILW